MNENNEWNNPYLYVFMYPNTVYEVQEDFMPWLENIVAAVKTK